MKRYWIVAPSKHDRFHHHDGAVVLASEKGAYPTCHLLDLTEPTTSMVMPRHKLAPWHLRDDRHQHCYCLREAP